jgi:DNA-directed RNA polymerase subunit M/transcription elongation factor TFIIS
MENISRRLFETLGLSNLESFLLAAKLKYGESSPLTYASQRHNDSAHAMAWLDRVMEKVAHLELTRDLHASVHTLRTLSGHQKTLDEIEQENERVKLLIASSKAERSSGFLTCRKCKSKDAIKIDQKQTRSADEPMTLFAQCEDCGFQWTVKG